jgi:hypothetical protein
MNDSLRFSIVAGVGLALFVVFLFLTLREDNIEAFIDTADAYDSIYIEYEPILHSPGSGSNVARRATGMMLNAALTADMDEVQRTKLSKDALVQVSTLEGQVERIEGAGVTLREHTHLLEDAAGRVRGYKAGTAANEMNAIAQERVLYIEELREILEGMNAQTRSIFERIIDDGGAMTDDHLRSLNQDLDGAEQQYDRLSAIYGELEGLKTAFTDAFFAIRVLKNK